MEQWRWGRSWPGSRRSVDRHIGKGFRVWCPGMFLIFWGGVGGVSVGAADDGELVVMW